MGNSFGTTGTLTVDGSRHTIHRLAGIAPPDLPYSLRIVLENLLRHEDGALVTTDQIQALLGWGEPASFAHAIDLHPARIFLHDTNGVPALVDLAAMRDAVTALGGDPAGVNPVIPAELVVDHSVIADVFGRADAFVRNAELEYARNAERYRFLKWGQAALRGLAVVPPGTGIMHQVNVEHLARVVVADGGWAYPDVCLGTDSHTTMVNGLGVLGWGIGGIEAEAAMLGQPVSMRIPQVVGVRLHGVLPHGATATDLVLTITELMRGHGVVGKFVEFSGPGVAEITLADRATIANMSPEFGSTCAYFPIDAETLRYLRFTGRPDATVALVEAYAKEQGLWHEPGATPRYTETLDLDLGTVVASLAGPRRPQDRVPLDRAKAGFRGVVGRPSAPTTVALDGGTHRIDHGSVAIAAITSCTNTSNPSVMVAAALLARNAATRGLRTKPWVKTSLSPGSRVVTDYYDKAGLTPHLEALGFHLTGYGCMTCIGASGPLIPEVTQAVRDHDLAVAAVLSGNRNFDSRINPDVRMNYLASPPLVVAYALAGTMDIDLTTEPLGTDHAGRPVYLRDIWPSPREVQDLIDTTLDPAMFARAYADVFAGDERWQQLAAPEGATFGWDAASTYLRRPPYLDSMTPEPPAVADITGARVLVKLGDSVTTDHISPAGAIPPHTPAGQYLRRHGVEPADLNTYASRRGNHEVMMRGTFANVRLRNQLVPDTEGGCTVHNGSLTTIYDAAAAYRAAGVPLLVLAGKEYGAGSSRDWAAKGPALLGVRAVLAESFERIHRSNLIGMGILPLQFLDGDSADTLGLTGHETFTVTGLSDPIPDTVTIHTEHRTFPAKARLDTPREAEYFRHGGIMPYVVRRTAHAR
ncbi:aconitate hydratase AcnA [Dactylosporangium sp. AC04546]|uniref:aconitate hydratase AcnA n=1 Tax=Dactylosporangium sp. AC04546 TaxID=2862460 RepID=UPI001EDEB8B5|nr:aconitate hydratase AcnA [Dactylosporangium sp. AC04546]WVK80691.1 aconitate hydratase AcnA [Dactylosporangium sp. AC04546]